MSPPPPAAIETEGVTDTEGITVPNPFDAPIKTNELYGRRKTPAKTQWGIAAVSTSESFKLRNHSHKPLAKRWDRTFKSLCGESKSSHQDNRAKLHWLT